MSSNNNGSGKLRRVRIKQIVTGDFRKSPRTLFDELKRNRKLYQGDPKPGDVYVFISSTRNQLVFITGERAVMNWPGSRHATEQMLLDYRGWRIENGTLSPLMLENYANSVGLSLGLKTLEEWHAERLAERRAG